MSFSPYSNFGYLILKPEAVEGVAEKPTIPVRVTDNSINAMYGHQDINEIAGERERRISHVEGQNEVTGEVEFFVEPQAIGHFLRSLFGAPVTQTLVAATSFRHTFNVTNTPKSYTFDMQIGDAPWCHRFFGLIISKLSFSKDDNAWKCTAEAMGRKAFTSARVIDSVNSGTTLTLDQTAGLTTSDTILILDKADGVTILKELTIASIDSETQLTTSTIDVQLDPDDMVVIKSAEILPSDYLQSDPFVFLGGSQIYVGEDIDNTSRECKEDVELDLMNEIEARYCSGLDKEARFASDLIIKGYTAEAKVTKFYNSESYLDKARANDEFGFRILMQKEVAISANAAVKARSYWGTGNGFYVEAATAGKEGNDFNVTIVLNDTDDLAASVSGKNVLIELANATAAKNTGTLIVAIVTALTGLDAAVQGTGAQEFTAAVINYNLGDTVSGATAAVVGRDASEKPYLEFNFAAAMPDNFELSPSEDEIVTQEVPLLFYKDVNAAKIQRKGWSTKIRLVNSIASY